MLVIHDTYDRVVLLGLFLCLNNQEVPICRERERERNLVAFAFISKAVARLAHAAAEVSGQHAAIVDYTILQVHAENRQKFLLEFYQQGLTAKVAKLTKSTPRTYQIG